MINILIVDDEPEKLRLLTEAILEVPGVDCSRLETARDAVSAKRLMKVKKYDLLILDINLPKRVDLRPEPDGGIETVRWLKGAGSVNRPSYIIGITAYDKSFNAAQVEFDNMLWNLVLFSYETGSWRERLKQSVLLCLDALVPPFRNDGSSYCVDLGVVVALEGVELDSILALPVDWAEIPVLHDNARYFRGSFSESHRNVDVVVVAAPNKGMSYSAIAATKLIYSFRPKYLAMAGICAGVPDKVNLGDVIFADPSWDWGSGKVLPKTRKGEDFHPAPYQIRMPEMLRARVKAIQEDQKWRASVAEAWPKKRPRESFDVHVGAIASGGSVLGSHAKTEEIRTQHKDLKGMEMEIFSVLCAAEYAPKPNPTAFALKGVCDFGNEKKNDEYHEYASYVCAQTLHRFALNVISQDLSD